MSSSKLPPLTPHFSPSHSPLNRTYEALLRDAHRKDALEERREQQKSPPPDPMSPPGDLLIQHQQQQHQQQQHHQQQQQHHQQRPQHTPEFDGSQVLTQRFASDLLERVGLNEERSEDALVALVTENDRDQLSTAPTPYSRTPESSGSGAYQPTMNIGASPAMLRRNHSLVAVLNDVQQVTLCFQEIIKHISFHRVNTGRVLWKLQATYVQLFERLIKVFSQRQKQDQEKIKEEGGQQNQELDMLRLQVMDKQAKLDAAEKTKHHFKDTIKEQAAHLSVLQNEVATLRAAIVEEASAADEAARRREADEKEIRHKVQLDVRDREDARKALFGGHEPSELDSAFTASLGTMHAVIEDADIQSQQQEILLNDMNSLMDVQQVGQLSFIFF